MSFPGLERQRSPARLATEALQGTSPLPREALVAARPVTRVREKILRRDSPRGLVNSFGLWCLPAIRPLPVAPALTVAFLSADRCFPVSLLRLPPRHFRAASRHPPRNSVGSLAEEETAAPSLSTDSAAAVAAELGVSLALPLDFCDGV